MSIPERYPENFDIIELTMTLMRFKTMHGHMDQIHDCMAYIASILERHDVIFRQYGVDGYPSLLVTPENGRLPVLLMSHIDVVDAPDALFEPALRDGRLYGRGGYDDKYAVALSMVLLLQWIFCLRDQGKSQSDMPFGILITSDEEIGGLRGAKTVLKDICPDFSIVLDGGSSNTVVTKEKGIARVRLTARGVSGHAARPWLGRNAIEILMQDYWKIKSHFRGSAPGHWHPTLNPGIIHGGTSVNQVPDKCELFLDIRYTENDDIQSMLDTIETQVESELALETLDPVFVTGPTPFLDRILALSRDIATDCEHGASDARHLVSCGRTGVVWGADGNLSQHSDNEHVDIASVTTLYRRLDRFVQGLEKPAG